ncbi:2-amino-4-hydroxy-6-hydroxymethyldihydropteridine diphosphokinase [Furfurilactobacillus entadae]|uniref:2-amino-4-hydroxy-6- hydroxymethyldihydropteridine diphosphokinase n=1 Tax=Furfurilactobacillus entadae TaxID=2922307 RepID=UPI0035EEA816
MTTAYLSLGANIGNRRKHLLYAIARLRADQATSAMAVAHFYETAPVGGVSQPDFLNTAVAVETSRSAESLLTFIHELEQAEHRHRFVHWGPRSLDIDIVFYGTAHIHTETLTVPHPEAANRRFVLEPLLEISGADRQLQRQLTDWLAETPDHQPIQRLG